MQALQGRIEKTAVGGPRVRAGNISTTQVSKTTLLVCMFVRLHALN